MNLLKSSFIILSILYIILPVFGQDREDDIFGDLISSLQSPTSASYQKSRNSEMASSEASMAGVLDMMMGNQSSNQDVFSVLANVTNPTLSRSDASSISGVMRMITKAYGNTGFYDSGSWDSNRAKLNRGSYYRPTTYANVSFQAVNRGRITSSFGYRARFKRMHKGIDIAMCVGDTVRVMAAGVVDKISYDGNGYGKYVIVKHDDGMETRYAHLSSPLVTHGQRVAAYAPIALSGNTGNSTGPHLHFETRLFGVAVDPTTIFDFSNGSYPSVPTYDNSNIQYAQHGKSVQPIRSDRSTYVVRIGDTMQKISQKTGVPLYRLCQLNFIMETKIPEPGTMLKLR